jgi:hypothetical protein
LLVDISEDASNCTHNYFKEEKEEVSIILVDDTVELPRYKSSYKRPLDIVDLCTVNLLHSKSTKRQHKSALRHENNNAYSLTANEVMIFANGKGSPTINAKMSVSDHFPKCSTTPKKKNVNNTDMILRSQAKAVNTATSPISPTFPILKEVIMNEEKVSTAPINLSNSTDTAELSVISTSTLKQSLTTINTISTNTSSTTNTTKTNFFSSKSSDSEEVEVVVLDFETTGLNPRKHRVIEVGAVVLRGRQVTAATMHSSPH